MIIECATCAVRDIACQDCVVSVLLGPVSDTELGLEERAAIAVLAGQGLVPPLRLVADTPGPPDTTGPPDATGSSDPWPAAGVGV